MEFQLYHMMIRAISAKSRGQPYQMRHWDPQVSEVVSLESYSDPSTPSTVRSKLNETSCMRSELQESIIGFQKGGWLQRNHSFKELGHNITS